VRAGRLHRAHRGVYSVGHEVLGNEARWMAAVLACGEGAVLSHGSAAALWGLMKGRPRRIHVSRPGTAGRGAPKGVHLHRYRSLDPTTDVTVFDAIRVTTVARTLFDLATYLPYRRVRRAVAEADLLGRLDLADIERLVTAHPRRSGGPALASIVRDYRRGDRSNSDFKDRLAELCERHALPAPRINVWIAGLEVDLCWPDARLVVEADSYAFHGTWAAFERDHERDAVLAAAGYVVRRFTDRQLERTPEAIVAAIRRSLSDSGRIAAAD
jgi:very-short-patch-repair endonuclease